MDPGKMRHQVALQRQQQTRTAAGGIRPGWQTIAIRPAAVEPLSGQELVHAQQVEPRTSHKVTMRYEPSLRITSTDRLRWTDRAGTTRVLGILSVRDLDEAGAWLELMATEKRGKAGT